MEVEMSTGTGSETKCDGCHRDYSFFNKQKECGRCEIARCSKCLAKTPSRIVGRANVPRKKVCASCNALICVPLMNAIALQCAPKSQLILFLKLMEVPLGENVEMDELIRLVCEAREHNPFAGIASPSAFHSPASSTGSAGSPSRLSGLPRIEIFRVPVSPPSRAGDRAGVAASGRGGSLSTRAGAPGAPPPAVNVSNLESALADQFLRLLLGAGPALGIDQDGFPMGFPAEQSDEDYQREQTELREQLKVEQEQRKAASVLDQIQDEAEIRELRVAQLKAILEANFVEHTDCVEKQELLDKVLALWKAQQTPVEELADSAICTICCENAINCVFLECGHLVACTDCGKKMEDCPMCRQPIKRCVHVFRN